MHKSYPELRSQNSFLTSIKLSLSVSFHTVLLAPTILFLLGASPISRTATESTTAPDEIPKVSTPLSPHNLPQTCTSFTLAPVFWLTTMSLAQSVTN